MQSFNINKGSDIPPRQVKWPAEGGGYLDLTGYEASLFDAHKALIDNMTFEVVDAVAGILSLSMQWDEKMPMGRSMSFRLRVSKDGVDITTSKMWINVT